MLSINDLRAGAYLVYNGDPYVVLKHSFIKMAQSKGIMRTSLKNLKTGKVLEETFKGQEKLEEADIRKSDIIVTSGLAGFYPKGLLIGEVIEVGEEFSGLSKFALIKPAADLSALEEVLVIVK